MRTYPNPPYGTEVTLNKFAGTILSIFKRFVNVSFLFFELNSYFFPSFLSPFLFLCFYCSFDVCSFDEARRRSGK